MPAVMKRIFSCAEISFSCVSTMPCLRRQKAVLQALFVQGKGRLEQGLSAKSYSKIAKVSGPTATRDLGAMERAGALRRSEAGGRSTVYWINF